MSPEAQRIAIAEACGWKYVDYFPGTAKAFSTWLCPKCNPHEEAPDYLNDLNAMHGAVMAQSGEFKLRFRKVLEDVAGSLHFHNATSTLRAEAFLRTLGKWDDSK